jgi:hypothetical protein
MQLLLKLCLLSGKEAGSRIESAVGPYRALGPLRTYNIPSKLIIATITAFIRGLLGAYA